MKKQLFKALAATAIVGTVMAMSSVVASAAVYTLNANDLTAVEITSKTTVGTDGFFTLLATDAQKDNKNSQNFTVDSNKKTGPITGTNYTQRLKSNGGSGADYRLIQFTLEKKSDIVIEGMSAKSSETRNLLYVKDGEFSLEGNVATNAFSAAGDKLYGTTLKDMEPGTYSFGFDNGFNIYGIVVTEKEATEESEPLKDGFTSVGDSAVYVVGEDTYIIAAVDEALMENDEVEIKLSEGSFDPAATTDTVYQSVMINGEDVVNQLDPTKYYYAIKVTGSKDARLANFTVE